MFNRISAIILTLGLAAFTGCGGQGSNGGGTEPPGAADSPDTTPPAGAVDGENGPAEGQPAAPENGPLQPGPAADDQAADESGFGGQEAGGPDAPGGEDGPPLDWSYPNEQGGGGGTGN